MNTGISAGFLLLILTTVAADFSSAQPPMKSKAGRPIPANHLVPAPDEFSGRPSEYHAAVREILGPKEWYKAIVQFIVMPSIGPEEFLSIQDISTLLDDGTPSPFLPPKFEIVFRYPQSPISGEKLNRSVRVLEHKRSISEKLALQIKSIWIQAISEVRYPKNPSAGADGASYYFTVPLRAGKTWSPEKSQPIPYALVNFGTLLERFAKTDEGMSEKMLFDEARKLQGLLKKES